MMRGPRSWTHVSWFSHTWFIYNLYTTYVNTVHMCKNSMCITVYWQYLFLTPPIPLHHPLACLCDEPPFTYLEIPLWLPQCEFLSTLVPVWCQTALPHPWIPLPLSCPLTVPTVYITTFNDDITIRYIVWCNRECEVQYFYWFSINNIHIETPGTI